MLFQMRMPWVALLVQLFTLAVSQQIVVRKFENKTDPQPDHITQVKDVMHYQLTLNNTGENVTLDLRRKDVRPDQLTQNNTGENVTLDMRRKDVTHYQLTQNNTDGNVTLDMRRKYFLFNAFMTTTNTNVVLATSTVFSSCLAAVSTSNNCMGKRKKRSIGGERLPIRIRYVTISVNVNIFSSLI